MLVTTKEMLLDAQKNHYAVGALSNVENLEFVSGRPAGRRGGENLQVPRHHADHLWRHQERPASITSAAWSRPPLGGASVPVALHRDHGDGYDRCVKAPRKLATPPS
ncbi:MAG: class II fructose-bisphosphate aldolase [Collinsella sp.]